MTASGEYARMTAATADLRNALGRRVREVWIEWAKTQPNPKPSWLVSYDDLSEADKEADRCIGSALHGDGIEVGMKMHAAMRDALASATTPGGPDAKDECGTWHPYGHRTCPLPVGHDGVHFGGDGR